MELVRNILLAIEKSELGPREWKDIEFDDVEQEMVSYHIQLLSNARLIDATNLSSMDGYEWKAISLTWNGHEFLDSIRNDAVWKKIKEKLNQEVSSLPLAVIAGVGIELTKEYAKSKFGLK
jgi:hypothetical protein